MKDYENSNKELLNRYVQHALDGKGDYARIKQQQTMAVINCSEPSTICNAFVIAKTYDSTMEWKVQDSKITACPATLHIGIKNTKTAIVCIGDEDAEESYFRLKKSENAQSKILSICAVIEVEECSIAFYYNTETNESYYIAQVSYGKESTDLFMIAKYLRDLEVKFDEEQHKQWNGLEKDEADIFSTWL